MDLIIIDLHLLEGQQAVLIDVGTHRKRYRATFMWPHKSEDKSKCI